MNDMANEWREAAARRERMGQPVTALGFRNAAFEIEQEDAEMEVNKRGVMLILQNDLEIYTWVMNLDRMHAGSFLRAIGLAAQQADMANYALMRPLLLDLKKKYPAYAKAIGRGA